MKCLRIANADGSCQLNNYRISELLSFSPPPFPDGLSNTSKSRNGSRVLPKGAII